MRYTDQARPTAKADRAIKRHETHKESAEAKAETRARRAIRSAKYSTAKVAY